MKINKINNKKKKESPNQNEKTTLHILNTLKS